MRWAIKVSETNPFSENIYGLFLWKMVKKIKERTRKGRNLSIVKDSFE